jgi:hypothetical protein
MGENQANRNVERDKITRMEMDRQYDESVTKKTFELNSQGGRKKEDPGLYGEAQ